MNEAMASVRIKAETTRPLVEKGMQASGTVAENTRRLDDTLSEQLGGLCSNGG